jgi:hypothetical protein
MSASMLMFHHSLTARYSWDHLIVETLNAVTTQKFSELIRLFATHGLDLSNEEPFGPNVSKKAKNKTKTVYEHTLSCGSKPALQEVMQAVAAIKK